MGAGEVTTAPCETLYPEASFPGLGEGRFYVGMWLTIELAKHYGVPLSLIDATLDRMPTNYSNLLDSADGMDLLCTMVSEALGQPGTQPFYVGRQ